MNKRAPRYKPRYTVKKILFIVLFCESLAIVAAITGAIALDLSPKTYFGEVNRGGLITWLSFIQLLIAAVLSRNIFKIVKSVPQLKINKSSVFWLTICLGLFFLALDDLLGIHEQMDYWIHQLFQLKETEVSDLIDDVIVGGYLIFFLIYVAFKWQIIKVFRRSFIFFKLGFILSAAMVILDVATNNRLFISMIIDDGAIASSIQQWLEVIEDSAKIFAEGMFIVGIYQCWQIAKTVTSDQYSDLIQVTSK